MRIRLTRDISLKRTIRQDSTLSFPLIKLGDEGNFLVDFMF